MKHSLGHTGVHRGKRVRVKLNNGEVFFDKFKERTDTKIVFFSGRSIYKKELSSLSILKSK